MRVVEVEGLELTQVPETKRGFSGLAVHDGFIYAATWDRVVVLDESLKVCREITDPRFSDLHGMHIEEDGTIWVASTNLDGVYTIRGDSVESFWHAWECDKVGEVLPWEEKDYRLVLKEQSTYHRLHVNSVFPTAKYVFVTYLGARYKPNIFQHTLIKCGLNEMKTRMGGILVLDRRTRKLIKRFQCEGLHDLVSNGNGCLYSTEYFGCALARTDVGKLSVKRVRLDEAKLPDDTYLTRGILPAGPAYWVGHTYRRNWHGKGLPALIRKYGENGAWTGDEIMLHDFAGIYEIVSL